MIEWIVSSWVLILVVILLRQLSKGRISSRLRYALWLPVLLRLLIPVSFGSFEFSAAEIVPEKVTSDVESVVTRPLGYVGYELPDLALPEPDPSLSESEQQLQTEKNLARWEYEVELAKKETGRAVTAERILLAVWIAGAVIVGLCLVISNLRFAARLRRSRVLLTADTPHAVYVSSIVETPCLFGLFNPAIYVTPEVAENESALRHVVAHEAAHARQLDHVWALLRGICLAVHWFAPPVWLAARLSRQDGELACDEGALKALGESERTGYGSTLIALATGHSSLLLTATTMSGGKRNLKERVKLIAGKPKTVAIAVVLVLIVAAVAVVCTFSGGEDSGELKAQLRKVEWAKEFTEMGEEKTQAMYDKVYECFAIYKAARPEDNVAVSSIGVARGEDQAYIVEVQCYGSDMAEFERLADLPDYVKLVYDPNALDQSENHPIPREPDSRNSYNNGGPSLMTMDRSVYPLYPETISYTWTAGETDVSYGAGYALHKYVKDEWQAVPKNPNTVSLLYVLQAGKTERREFTPPRLGEGLYRLTVETYSVEFAVSAEVEVEPYPETAYVYEVEFDHLANEQKIRELIGNNAGADGNLNISDSSIYLLDRSLNGRRMEFVLPYNAKPDATYAYQLRGISKDDYGSEDLSFMPMKKAEKKVLEDIEALGISGFEIIESYSIDKETMSRHVAAALEAEWAVQNVSEEELQKMYPFLYEPITDEDECYFFVFQMKLDDLPAATDFSSQVELDIYGVELYCLYGKAGIIALHAERVPSTVKRTGEAQSVIPAGEAYDILLKYLPRNAGTTLNTELTFCYTYHDRKSTELRPTWVMKIWGEFERLGLQADKNELVTVYNYYAIDAITGEPLIREMKLKDAAAYTGLNTDASIGEFKWGMTRDEAIKLAETMAAEKGFTVISSGDRFVSLKGYPIFGSVADITLDFSQYSPEHYPTLGENTERLLVHAEMIVKPAEREGVVSEICAVLGEQETRQLVFYNHGGDIGYEFSSEISDERRYYWHGRQNIIESLGIEKLKEIYPNKTEKEILEAFYNTYEYTVSVHGSEYISNLEEDELMVVIEASASVIKDILLR